MPTDTKDIQEWCNAAYAGRVWSFELNTGIPPMFDHFTQISAVQERAVLLQQASGFVEFSEEPLALIENLPKGLIEDQI
jgi:hypothetical protein